ncbi:MAG: TetR/AcrR family transcriptional regulator [Deltaproteobacteria bacterium]|nr:TetR/AcrR family transcriptional regulator [Deltaproteobacteria bacterium]
MMELTKKRLQRREEQQRRQRREILAEALELFSRRGYHNVSMNDIAQEAAYAVGTIYKFFSSKEELYRAIISDVSEQFAAAAAAALAAEGNEYEKIIAYLQAGSRVFRSNSKAVRLYFAETHGVSFNFRTGLDRETVAMHEQMLASLAAVFAAGIEKGFFHPLDPEMLARALDSLALAFLFVWLDDTRKCSAAENLEMIEKIFFRGVMTPSGKKLLLSAEGR